MLTRHACFSLSVPSALCPQVLIKGNGNKQAEMVTDEGAIYVTSNGGYNWKAAVEETVSATLNRCVRAGTPFIIIIIIVVITTTDIAADNQFPLVHARCRQYTST